MSAARSMRVAAGVALLAAMASGCTLGPDYKRPQLEVPQAWRDAPVPDAETIANTPWWDLFRDPALDELIRIALAGNQDLRIAAERVIEQQARVGVVRSALFPQLDLGVNASSFEASRKAFPHLSEPADRHAELYEIAGDLTWELDVFGRIRRATEAERAILVATDEGRRAVTISLVASVARTYTELRDLDLRLEISRRTLDSRAKSVDLTRSLFRGGVASEMDFRQAEAEYRRVEATVKQFEQLVRQKENEISALIGRIPGDIARGGSIADAPMSMAVPAGLPSELIDRRPDVRAAEEQLHASTADVGAAKALLFPRFALTADIGTSSTELNSLFSGSAQAWSVAAGVLQPIFNAGRNRRRVEIAESQMRQSLYGYEQSMLEAFREVEDALIGYQKTGEQRLAQHQRVQAERSVVDLATARYEGGVADYLEVLDAQRSLFSAELDEVDAIGEQMVSLIQLYKALGGGWPAGEEPANAAATSPATAHAHSAPPHASSPAVPALAPAAAVPASS
jgi:multidrug efflux system outer membrane protein